MAIETFTERAEEIPQDELTAEYAAKLLFHSFRFSQGSPGTQRLLFQFIHELHPDWRINVDMNEAVLARANNLVNNYMFKKGGSNRRSVHALKTGFQDGQNKNISKSDTRESIQDMLTIMADNLESYIPKDEDNIPKLAHAIMLDIAESDGDYLLRDSNRRPHVLASDGNKKSPFTDPWFSFICFYALEGNTTGISEFDELFAEISKVIRSAKAGDPSNNLIRHIIDIYAKRHPDIKIALEQQGD